jgi:hypothetical protein
MATPTKLESKLAEVLGLAMAAQDAVREVRGMLGGEHQALDKRLVLWGDDAREVERRCKALAANFTGKKTAILDSAREVKKDTIAMRGDEDLRKLTEWALPIQERHLQEVLDGSLKLAADADPAEEEG